jgi:hypothetical protein
LRGFFVTLIKIKGMNKTVKKVLLILGIILLTYGIYTIIIPETEISIGNLNLVKTQDNSKSYITIGFGIIAIFLCLIKGKE